MEEDWGKKIDALLSSPDGMAKIQGMMNALGGSITPNAETESKPAVASAVSESSDTALPDLSGLLSLAPLLSSFSQEDNNTALLRALRPYLHGEREKRLDQSMQLMKLMNFLPLLKEKGVLK